jgi:hypothetical protein
MSATSSRVVEWNANHRRYGDPRIYNQLRRRATRSLAARSNGDMSIRGVQRGGQRWTTVADKTAPRPVDLVQRMFIAQRSNQLWLANITYASTGSAWLYIGFILDCYGRMVATTARPTVCAPTWSSTRSRWRSGNATPPPAPSCTTPAGELHTRASDTQIASESLRPSVRSVTSMTTRSPKRSTAISRPRQAAPSLTQPRSRHRPRLAREGRGGILRVTRRV